MKAEGCKSFDSCSVPFCPLDYGNMDCAIWYPDEPICMLQAFCHETWIRNQKKIAKKSRNVDFYFTRRMLEQNCVIGKEITGLDPDHDKDEVRWLKEHPKKRVISEAEREKLKNRMLELRKGLNPSE